MALKALYQLEDLNDSSGNGYNLTNYNSVTFTAGKFANCANFGNPNTTKCLYVANALGITNGAITMMGWLQILSTAGGRIFAKGNTTNYVEYIIDYTSTTISAIRCKPNVGSNTATYTYSLATGKWYHIALVYDTTNIIMYVNGYAGATAAASGNGTSTPDTTANNFTMGSWLSRAGGFAPILIDKVSVYDSALSPSQIMSEYRKGFPLGGGIAIGSPAMY